MNSIATYLNSVAIEIYSVEAELKSPATKINPFTTDKLSDIYSACHIKTLHFIFRKRLVILFFIRFFARDSGIKINHSDFYYWFLPHTRKPIV